MKGIDKLISSIVKLFRKTDLGRRINGINQTLLIFLILASAYASFKLSSNEEQYMLYAKQFMNPDWIDSWFLNEFPGTRLVYQYLLGSVLQYLSFETTTFIFRLLLCLLFAIPLGGIYRHLKINNVHVLFHLPILFLMNQSFFAGSWMFVTVEPKGFAYVFILFAIYQYLRSRYWLMLVYLVLASYFHVLVGGYAFMCLMLCLFLFYEPAKRKQYLYIFLVYVLLMLPFAWYLSEAVSNKVQYTPTVDWIYTYFRSPHHTALFKDLTYFYDKHFYGVIWSIMAFLFCIYYFKKNRFKPIGKLNVFVLVSLFTVFIGVIIAIFDREGVLLKYYPFRIVTVSTLLFTLIMVKFLFDSIKGEIVPVVQYLVIFMAAVGLMRFIQPTLLGMYRHFKSDPYAAINDMSEFIKANTNKGDVILCFGGELSLNRRTERDRFVVYKFIPAVLNDIPEWYERQRYKNELEKNFEKIIEKPDNYRIDYLLSTGKLESENLESVYSNGRYRLYKINLD